MRVTAIALLLALLAGCGGAEGNGNGVPDTFEVGRGSMRITLTESGSLQARMKTNIRPEIKTGASVLSLVDEGTIVKEGDVLVELDKDSVEKEIEKLEDTVIQLEADLKSARTDYEIQEGENESQIEQAKLDLDFAKLELERYLDGDHPQQLRELKLRIDQTKSELKQAEDYFRKMPELHREGFVTDSELEKKRLEVETATVDVKSADLALELYNKYTHPMTEKQKKANVVEAEREFGRTKARAEARIEQKGAVLRQKTRQFEAAALKLDEAKAELGNLTIRAPQAGIVIYGGRRDRWGNIEDELKVGSKAYPGRTLIELPDLTLMDAKIQIHQADVGKVRPEQTAWVTVPGKSGVKFEGRISEIASVAQSRNWRDPVKRFDVIVELVDRVDGLRAGVTVEVEIDLGEIEDILYVPLQAVDTAGRRFFVYRQEDGEVKRATVRLGRSNEQYVEVVSGLEPGDEILLSVPEVVAEDEESEEEAPPAGGPGAGKQGQGRPGSGEAGPSSSGKPRSGRPAGGSGRSRPEGGDRSRGRPNGGSR